MTEAEWFKCDDPVLMLDYLQDNVSDRKLRLFGCACVRRVWYLLTNKHGRRAVEVAEKYADGLAKQQALHQAAGKANWARQYAAGPGVFALAAAVCVADKAYMPGLDSIRRSIVQAIKAVQAISDPGERIVQASFLRDVVGNPFRPCTFNLRLRSSNESTVSKIADQIYEDCSFSLMPSLSDALAQAGCNDEVIIMHCQSNISHIRGCWVVDLILGKN